METNFTHSTSIFYSNYTDYEAQYGDTSTALALVKFVEAKVPTIPMSWEYLKRFTIAGLNPISLVALPKETNLDGIPDGKSDLIDYLIEHAQSDWRLPEFEFATSTSIAEHCTDLMAAPE